MGLIEHYLNLHVLIIYCSLPSVFPFLRRHLVVWSRSMSLGGPGVGLLSGRRDPGGGVAAKCAERNAATSKTA